MQRFSRVKRGLKYGLILLALCFGLPSPLLGAWPQQQPQRPRITGIDHVTIYASDINKSRQFYSDVFGLTTGCPQYKGSEPCFLVGPANQRVLLKQAPIEAKNWTL